MLMHYVNTRKLMITYRLQKNVCNTFLVLCTMTIVLRTKNDGFTFYSVEIVKNLNFVSVCYEYVTTSLLMYMCNLCPTFTTTFSIKTIRNQAICLLVKKFTLRFTSKLPLVLFASKRLYSRI